MSPEKRNMPEWARQERQADLAWIQENLDIFEIASRIAYADTGRGVLVVDTTVRPVPGIGHPFGYLSQEQIDEQEDAEITRIVQEYDPEQEFVLVLLKQENRTSTYRLRSRWGSEDQEGDA